MEHIIKKIKKGAKHTRLSVVEKAEMRSALVRHVKANPVDSATISLRPGRESADSEIPSPFFNINNFRNKKGISILVIGGLLMSGSVSFAAENTVPGDVLFPVKVHVNENVRGAVAVTSKAKAEWEVRLVERRLEEVEKLATIPNVLPEVQQVAEQNLEHYSDRVKNRIAKFEEDEDDEDAIETAFNLSDVYNTHEQVLLAMNVPSIATTTVSAIHSVSNESIKDTLKKVQGARGDAEKKHKELKEKYDKEKVVEAERVMQEYFPQVKEQIKASKTRSDNKDRKQKELKSFRPGSESTDSEIRSTVVPQETSSIGSSETQNEVKKLEDKDKEEARVEVPKVDDND